MRSERRLIIGIIGIILVFIGLYAVRYFKIVDSLPPVIACSADGKLCPDGTVVGRVGPECTFAACPTPKPNLPKSWRQYQNKEFGFSFAYPATSTLKNNFSESYHLWNRWTLIDDPSQGRQLAAIELVPLKLPSRPTESLLVAELRLGTSAEVRDREECLQGAEPVKLGNTTAYRVPIGQVGMNQFTVGSSYRILRGDTCLAVEPVIAGVNPGVYISSEAEMAELERLVAAYRPVLENTLNAILATARFTNP